jgi:integrase
VKHNLLTIKKMAAATKAGKYGDGCGLYLHVGPTGSKSWVLRYMLNGHSREMGLGSYHNFSLNEARARAREARQLLTDGIDPIDRRQAKIDAAIAEKARQVTFATACSRFLEEHLPKWKGHRYRRQWTANIEDACAALGDLPVDAIEVAHITNLIRPMWNQKQVRAKRLLSCIATVLGYATVHQWRRGDNPAKWDGHLETVFAGTHEVKNYAALPIDAMPAFMEKLKDRDSILTRVIEFLILTVTRKSEAKDAAWSEINLEQATWTIPAERMKGGREHTVPLSKQAIALLQSLPRKGDLVFGVSSSGLNKEFWRLVEKGAATLHGFRSTFRDWAGDRTEFDRETIEHALAHKLKDKSEAAYRRSTALNKRALLMQAWANFVCGVEAGSNVVALHV